MRSKIALILFLAACLYHESFGQCTTRGQTPASAFPVCGDRVFVQNTVPLCSNGFITTGSCGAYDCINPFFYSFTCYKTGTLDFLITPNDLGDDYDWQIFDITGVTNLDDIYKDERLILVGNWSGTYGITGTKAGHSAIQECASIPGTTDPLSEPPVITAGHNYLLIVSHYTPTQSGYKLSFGGGTGVITDTARPALKSASTSCGGNNIFVVLTKKVKCSSLAANGSDFALASPLAKITKAFSTACSTGFDFDTVMLTVDKPLPPGTYKVVSKKGSDGNTVLNDCDNAMAQGDTVAAMVDFVPPTPMDSIKPVPPCSPKSVTLVFSKPVLCSSVDFTGSDFTVTGPSAVTVSKAYGAKCENDLTDSIVVEFSSPILIYGTYKITLKAGRDGNTIIDSCLQQTPAGMSLNFKVSSAVNPAFNVQVKLGCVQDTIAVYHDGNGGANSWQWVFDDSSVYTSQSVYKIYKQDFGLKTVLLTTGNGICSDTASQMFILDNRLKAQFAYQPVICPGDNTFFIDSSVGKNMQFNWYFANGTTSTVENPPGQSYPYSTGDKYYNVRLIVSSNGCYDTAYHQLKVLYSCYIAVPTAFTPNGDGLNDYLYPYNALKARNIEFRVYNRWGKQIFISRDWTSKWDGTVKGIPQPAGVYVWQFSYTDGDTGESHFLKGTTVLIR